MGLVPRRRAGHAAADRRAQRLTSVRGALSASGGTPVRQRALCPRGPARASRGRRQARRAQGCRGLRPDAVRLDERDLVLLLRPGRESPRVLVTRGLTKYGSGGSRPAGAERQLLLGAEAL